MKNTFSVFKFRNDNSFKSVIKNNENIFYGYSFNNRPNQLANEPGHIFNKSSASCDRKFTSSNKELYVIENGRICSSALIIVVGIIFLLLSCSDKKYSDKKIYGNSFINIEFDNGFKQPLDWRKYSNDVYDISIPYYMKRQNWDVDSFIADKPNVIVFRYNDKHYGRIEIVYTKGDVKYNYADHMVDIYEQNTKKQLDEIVTENVDAGTIHNGLIKVKEAKLLNGPFYACYNLSSNQNNYASFYVVDVFYRRSGYDGNGPVSCHIFFLQNRSEMVRMTISYRDSDSTIFKNMFNVVRTFRWNKINSIYSE